MSNLIGRSLSALRADPRLDQRLRASRHWHASTCWVSTARTSSSAMLNALLCVVRRSIASCAAFQRYECEARLAWRSGTRRRWWHPFVHNVHAELTGAAKVNTYQMCATSRFESCSRFTPTTTLSLAVSSATHGMDTQLRAAPMQLAALQAAVPGELPCSSPSSSTCPSACSTASTEIKGASASRCSRADTAAVVS